MSDFFLILGVDLDASEAQIDEAFHYLSAELNPTNFPNRSAAENQALACMAAIVPAYQTLRAADRRDAQREIAIRERALPFNPDDFKPFLGHLCVAAGIISFEELLDAIGRQSDIDLPLGQILQEKALLSQTELDGLLMGQRLFGSPSEPLDALTRRLMALGLISADMIKIVLIDKRTSFFSTVPELLMKRGWLSEEIFGVITSQSELPSSIN